MFDFSVPDRRALTLDLDRVGRRTHLSREFLERVTAETWPDRAVDRLMIQLQIDVVSEHLPTHRYRLMVTDPRWASWWDHLKATYAQRWWAAAFVRRHPPRTVDTPIAAEFDVRSAWHYPDTPLMRQGLGRPVMWTETSPVTDDLDGDL